MMQGIYNQLKNIPLTSNKAILTRYQETQDALKPTNVHD